jgi:GntR family transcriptional regulator
MLVSDCSGKALFVSISGARSFSTGRTARDEDRVLSVLDVLDRESSAPMYHQLANIFRQRVRNGEWAVGGLIPSDRELCQQYGVSKFTILQALGELVREGLLRRAQGRGTIVVRQRVEHDLTKLRGFSEDMLLRGLQPSSRVLRAEIVPCPADVAAHLAILPDEEVVRLERVRFADGRPLAVETHYHPAMLCPGLTQRDLSGSLKAILENEYALKFDHATQWLRARPATTVERKILQIPRDTAVLEMLRVTYTPKNLPFEYLESSFRGDQYNFVVTLHV